jgi:hypothetical protein
MVHPINKHKDQTKRVVNETSSMEEMSLQNKYEENGPRAQLTLGKTKDNFNHEKEVDNFSTSTSL